MKTSLHEALSIRRSLIKQALLFIILFMAVGIALFSAMIIYETKSQGEIRIQRYREELLARKKEELKNYTDIIFKNIDGLDPAQIVAAVKNSRYGTTGYFWINDITSPFPKMIMHPTLPGLDGKILDDAKFNCALGKRENLFVAFNDVCLSRGEGYVDYLWPKPMKTGLTEDKPKLSYVRLYKPLNWVIGTGLYIDDIDALVMKERQIVEKDVSVLISRVILVSLVIFAALALVGVYFFNKFIGNPIKEIIHAIQKSEDDLTVQIPVMSQNEIGELARWYNTHIANLREIVKNFFDSAIGVNNYARDMSIAIEQQAAVASEQSASVTEITATMAEFSASSSTIAEHAQTVESLATGSWESTVKGSRVVEIVISKMSQIDSDNQTSTREIVELGRKSKEITKVMEIINGVADRTKLIAFNAAIEASDAGESGKRFGVVAAEIRRLADSVMESTGEIEAKIGEIQEAINRLVVASEKNSKGIQDGLQSSQETAAMVMALVDVAQSTQEAAKQISLSTQQQKTASNQVVSALREISLGSGQTSDSIRQISSVSKEMMQLSDNLKSQVDKFKIS